MAVMKNAWVRRTYLLAEFADFALGERLAVEEHFDVFVETFELLKSARIKLRRFSHFAFCFKNYN